LRYTLKFKDGRVLQGEVVGEVGTSLLFRDERSTDGIRVVHIHELVGAWKADGMPRVTGDFESKPAMVTFEDEFRIIDAEEVDSLLEDQPELSTKYPPPGVYYETNSGIGDFIFSCENFGLEREDIEVRLTKGRIDIYFITGDGPKQLAFSQEGEWLSQPKIIVNDTLIEVSVSVG
jgi:hypothetical protein